MNIFSSITEVGLKRLYKYVLKKAIGRYINDDLDIDQLEVSSNEGYIIINDIDIDCNVINDDYLNGYTFQVSATTTTTTTTTTTITIITINAIS